MSNSANARFVIALTIPEGAGLHMRPSAELVDLAKSFKACIRLHHQDLSADAKSMLDLMVLGSQMNATSSREVTIECDGEDAEQAGMMVARALTSLA